MTARLDNSRQSISHTTTSVLLQPLWQLTAYCNHEPRHGGRLDSRVLYPSDQSSKSYCTTCHCMLNSCSPTSCNKSSLPPSQYVAGPSVRQADPGYAVRTTTDHVLNRFLSQQERRLYRQHRSRRLSFLFMNTNTAIIYERES